MIDLVDFFRIVNTFIAILAIPASISMFIQLTNETHVVPKLPKKLALVNKILRMMFLGIAISAFSNAVLSAILILKLDFSHLGSLGDIAFNLRNLVVNTFFTASSWSFFLIRKEQKKVS